MKKVKIFIIFSNLIIILIIVSFFTFIFIKNFSQIKNIFARPTIPSNNEANRLIQEFNKNIQVYFELKNSTN